MDLIKILKLVPKGTKLYSTIHGEVLFNAIMPNTSYPITYNINGVIIGVTSKGKYNIHYNNGECVLFPSKNNRDWNNFVYKEDYSINTPMMVSNDFKTWHLRYYADNNTCFVDGLKNNHTKSKSLWNYMIPVKEFDFVNQRRKQC